MLNILNFKYTFSIFNLIEHLELCDGDSGGPLWDKSKTILAVYTGRINIRGPCGHAYNVGQKITLDEIRTWVDNVLAQCGDYKGKPGEKKEVKEKYECQFKQLKNFWEGKGKKNN